jgi:heme-degrading monooxygenase HmoA
MKRRAYLRAVAVGSAAAFGPTAAPQAAKTAIQLHVDLDVDPAKEKEMLSNFRSTFQPVIRKQPGFVDVKLLKLREALAGPAPKNAPYRLIISFETEEFRKKWVATDEHQRVWPTIEKTLRGQKYGAVLYDAVI